MVTCQEAISQASQELANCGIEGSSVDARLLLMAATGWSREDLLLKYDQGLTAEQRQVFADFIERRKKREPVSRILGEREFWSLPFKINEYTLDPRPDSETLIEASLALEDQLPKAPRILDLGTGSGCLLLALLSEWPLSHGVGVDLSNEAVAAAQENSKSLGLAIRSEFCQGNWCLGLEGQFDLIVSNPPYIAEEEQSDLEPEVLDFDPSQALFAKERGLAEYKVIISQAPSVLKSGGFLAFEHGHRQQKEVEALLCGEHWRVVAKKLDLSGQDRVIIAQFSSNCFGLGQETC